MFHMVNRLKRCFKMFQNGVEWAKRHPRGMTYVQCASPEHEMLNMAHRTSVKTKKRPEIGLTSRNVNAIIQTTVRNNKLSS